MSDDVGKQGMDSAAQRAARDSLFLKADIKLPGGRRFHVRVRNLSEGGMMIDGDAQFVPETPVIVELGGIGLVQGHIAWAEAGRAGIAFDAPINPKAARYKAPEPPKMMSAPRFDTGKRPGLRTY